MSAWLDHVAAELLTAEENIRSALRHERHQKRGSGGGLNVSFHTLRALLRGIMPAPIATTRLREPHARLVTALTVFQAHLVAMNDPLNPPGPAIQAAITLRQELGRWTYVLRWSQACLAARLRWPVPPSALDIMALVQPQTTEHPFRHHELPKMRHTIARPLTERLRLNGLQKALDLDNPNTAEIIDIRQLRLNLEVPHHARSAHA